MRVCKGLRTSSRELLGRLEMHRSWLEEFELWLEDLLAWLEEFSGAGGQAPRLRTEFESWPRDVTDWLEDVMDWLEDFESWPSSFAKWPDAREVSSCSP